MGNRAHWQLLAKYPFLRRKARGFHADGPDKGQKRIWAHRWRARIRHLLHQDPDNVSYPKKCGNKFEWY